MRDKSNNKYSNIQNQVIDNPLIFRIHKKQAKFVTFAALKA
jgi:hypothetical protein